MELTKGSWTFKKNIPEKFDSHINKSVPLYEEFYKWAKELSYWFLQENSYIYDLGSSTGRLALELQKIIQERNVIYQGFDTSKEMIEYSQNNLTDFIFHNQDVLTIDFKENISMVFSVLTLQFLPLNERKLLIQKIYKNLNKGGAFILFEKTLAPDSEIENIFDEIYQEFKLDNLFSYEHLFQKKQSLRGVMRTVNYHTIIQTLKEIGFVVHPFLQWGDFVGILALKR